MYITTGDIIRGLIRGLRTFLYNNNNKGIIGSLKRDECGWGFFFRQFPRIVRQVMELKI
jgi:hypothetical protein